MNHDTDALDDPQMSVEKRDVAVGSLLAILWGAHTAFVNPLFALYFSRDLGLTQVELSVSLVLFNLVGLAVSFLLPLACDRTGRVRPWLLLCSASAIACSLAAGLGLSGATAVFNLIFLGGPSLASVAVLFTYYKKRAFSDRQTLRFRGLFAAAWTVGPPAAAFVVDTFSFRAFFLCVAAIGCASLVASLALRDGAFTGVTAPSVARRRVSFAKSLRLAAPAIGPILCALILLQTSNSASVSLLPLLASAGPDGARLAGLALGLCAALEVSWLMILARIRSEKADLRFNGRMMALGSLAGFLYLTVLAVSTRVEVVLVGQLLNSFFIAAVMGSGLLWMQSAIPTRAGLATALYSNTSRIGAILAAPVIALYSTSFVGVTSLSPLVGAVLCLIALAICLWSMRHRPVV